MALQTLLRERPDLVVLDLMLPKVSGEEVLQHVRSEDGLKDIPVLILSNAYVNELAEKAMKLGATQGMLKTDCTPARLVETIRDMLGFASAFDLSDKAVTDDSQAAAFAAAAEAAMADEETLKKNREEFIRKMPAAVAKIRESSLAYIKAAGTAAAQEPLHNLNRQVHFFANWAGMSDCGSIAILASAFEALLFEAVHKPEKTAPSASQTIAQAVDCLERLAQNSGSQSGGVNLRAKILIVDDDATGNAAMAAALKRAHLEAVCVEDSARALETAAADVYDAVLINTHMPRMNGFELCGKFRRLPEYQTVPILFLTSSADFQSRARGILCGGNDLIAKPVSPVESVVKISLHLLQPHGPWAETNAVASVLKTTMRLMKEDQAEAATPDSAVPQNAAAPDKPSLNGVSENAPIPFTVKEPLLPAAPVPSAPEPPAPVSPALVSPALVSPALVPPVPVMDTAGTSEKTESVQAAVSAEVPERVEPEKPVSAGPDATVAEIKAVEIKEAVPKIEPVAADKEAPPVEPLPLPNVIPLQPNSEPSQTIPNMDKTTKSTFDEASRGVARIIFGDENVTDMNVRLTRIALERYNVPGNQNLQEVARGVAKIMFGDENITDMNVRLTRIALESYNISENLGANGHNGHKKAEENGVPQAVGSF